MKTQSSPKQGCFWWAHCDWSKTFYSQVKKGENHVFTQVDSNKITQYV